MMPAQHTLSVSNSTPTRYILRPAPATGPLDYGMYKEARVYGCSLDNKARSPLWPLVQTAVISQLAVCNCESKNATLIGLPGEDLAVNLWDIGSGKRIKKMTGHTGSIYSLAFSAESSLLVSGGADWTVRCWDIKSAGGLPTKPKENGVTTPYTPLGMANNEPVVKSSSDEESIET